MAVEDLDGISKRIANDRPLIPIRPFFQVRRHAFENIVEIFVVAKVGFAPNGFHESSETLVEPRVGPIAAREQVAKPLMSELV